ncbi:MAG: WS/DGAT/MGAT family O-acyltransferase [Acidimicrobiales bacterium]
MRRLGGLDGAFLAFESPTAHLHMAGVLIFDPTGVPDGVGFRQIRELVEDRLPRVQSFRSRMIDVPFGLQHATMVDDPDFDIDFHVRRVSLPAPGGLSELTALVGDIVSRPLDRRRPLWEFHVVEGLDHGHVALVSKVHHSMIDGVSGAELMAVFFDLSADASRDVEVGPGGGGAPGSAVGPGPEGQSETWAPQPLRGDIDQVLDALGSLRGQADGMVRTLGSTVRSVRNLTERNRQVRGLLPPTLFQAPRTSINRAISSHRRVAFAEVRLDDIRRIRDVMGGTVNDVVLAAVAGGMRAFFSGRGETLESSLVALVPKSLRDRKDHGGRGNQVSAMLVSLATGVEDPVARLNVIRDGMAAAKEQHRAIGPEVFFDWAHAMIPALATRMTRLVTNLRVFDHLPPPFNVIVSNIPGPDVPVYLAGAPMVAMYPVGPVVEGVGVNITVFSYLGALYVGVQGCWDLVPDIDVIANGIADSVRELAKEANRRDRPLPWWHMDAEE